jgi:transposase
VAEPVRARRLTDQEGQRLQQIVRRGSTSSVYYRRAMMLLASAGGNRVPVIAQLVQADEDTVRDVIHRFNEIGLACLDPRWAGGRPRQLRPDEKDFVVATATTRPTRLGRPFTHWSLHKLAACLRTIHGRVIRIGRETLRCLLGRRGITFQRTKTWKESTGPERDTKLDRIEHVLEHFPDRTLAFDEFGPLGIRPTGGACWAEQGRPDQCLLGGPDRGAFRAPAAVHPRRLRAPRPHRPDPGSACLPALAQRPRTSPRRPGRRARGARPRSRRGASAVDRGRRGRRHRRRRRAGPQTAGLPDPTRRRGAVQVQRGAGLRYLPACVAQQIDV